MHHSIPGEVPWKYCGCRVGARMKTSSTNSKRWRYKPSVPSILMGNVNALQNKVYELAGLMTTQTFYRESSLTNLTLTSSIPDANVELFGFTVVRADRDTKTSSKSKGGGLLLYMNNRWCNPSHLTVKDTLCCHDLELVADSMRPYYLHRGFTQAIVVCVYIPPRADAGAACKIIHALSARLQIQHPEALFVISGDFNHVTLTSALAGFHQSVDYPTRKNRTIDLMYANVRDAYTTSPLPPLGKSDHNLICLTPLYTPLVKGQPITTNSIRKWKKGDKEILRDCFETTDWHVMLESFGEDTEGSTHCITDYLNFCLDAVVGDQ